MKIKKLNESVVNEFWLVSRKNYNLFKTEESAKNFILNNINNFIGIKFKKNNEKFIESVEEWCSDQEDLMFQVDDQMMFKRWDDANEWLVEWDKNDNSKVYGFKLTKVSLYENVELDDRVKLFLDSEKYNL